MIDIIEKIKNMLPNDKKTAIDTVQDIFDNLSRDHQDDPETQMGLVMARSMIPDIIDGAAQRAPKPADINQCILLLGEFIGTGKSADAVEEMRKYLIGDLSTDLNRFHEILKELREKVKNDPVATFHVSLVTDYFKPPEPVIASEKDSVRFNKLIELLLEKGKGTKMYKIILNQLVTLCKVLPREWYVEQIDKVTTTQYSNENVMSIIIELNELMK
jgi:hypothetical protein